MEVAGVREQQQPKREAAGAIPNGEGTAVEGYSFLGFLHCVQRNDTGASGGPLEAYPGQAECQ